MKRGDFAPYIEHLAKMHPLAFVRTLDSLKDHSALGHLPHVDVPTIVIGGEGDRFTPVWLSQRMAELIPGRSTSSSPAGPTRPRWSDQTWSTPPSSASSTSG